MPSQLKTQVAAQGEREESCGPIISFEDVRFTYPGEEARALDGVSLDVMPGECLAVIGPNGGGKSTLLLHMNALLVPDGGHVRVRVDEQHLDSANKRGLAEIRRACSMVFQNPDEQTVASTVEEDVAFGPENLGLSSEEIRHRVDECLSMVGLDGFQQRMVFGLSRGQRQRVAVAGALAMRPAVLLCDEPTAMLDAEGKRDVMAILRQVHAEGCAVVLVTHDMEEVLAANRIIVVEGGQIVMEGTPRELFSRKNAARLREMGLELPAPARYAVEHGLPDELPLTIEELVARVTGGEGGVCGVDLGQR